MQNQYIFGPLSLRPCWKQLILNQVQYILLCVLIFVAYFWLTSLVGSIPANKYLRIIFFIIRQMVFFSGICMLVYLFYQLFYFLRMEYIITDDQIIFQHGVFSHSTDYMELYRVIDYKQERTLLQQMTGLKTVIIYSGDRNVSVMHIIGVLENVDVVREIRKRVEYNKEIKHIYEITNRS